MVRVPLSYLRAGFVRQAGSLRAQSPQIRRPRVTDISMFTQLVTVDIGNDGTAPVAIFSASGAAAAQIGPQGLGQSWSLDQAYMSTSVGPLDAATVVVYVGPLAIVTTAVSNSLEGGGSQFGLGGLAVPDGWFVFAVWAGGTPGAQAYLRVTGTKTVQAGPYGW